VRRPYEQGRSESGNLACRGVISSLLRGVVADAMRREGHELVLVASSKSSGASGRVVGRISRVPISPQGRPWFCADASPG
jgi:hypothetical protein